MGPWLPSFELSRRIVVERINKPLEHVGDDVFVTQTEGRRDAVTSGAAKVFEKWSETCESWFETESLVRALGPTSVEENPHLREYVGEIRDFWEKQVILRKLLGMLGLNSRTVRFESKNREIPPISRKF
jgi:hypothetical protein